MKTENPDMPYHVSPRSASIFAFLLTMGHSYLAQIPTAQADGLPVNQVIEAIKYEINQATIARDKREMVFEITSVDVILTGTASYQGEFGVSVEIPIVERVAGAWVNVGGKLANTQTISLTLVPQGGAIQVAGSENLGLLPAIESVKSALRPTADNDLRFRLQSFDFDLQFAMEKSVEGGFRFIFIDTAEVGYEEIAIQRITIHMEPAE